MPTASSSGRTRVPVRYFDAGKAIVACHAFAFSRNIPSCNVRADEFGDGQTWAPMAGKQSHPRFYPLTAMLMLTLWNDSSGRIA